MEYKTGLIVKAISGFYYVKTQEGILECRACGIFRKQGQQVYTGDYAKVELTEEGHGYVVKIEERKNFLVRPPLANIDQLVMVVSTCEPQPNLLVLDKLIAIAEHKGLEPLLVFTKKDKEDSKAVASIYRHAGFGVEEVSNKTGEGIAAVRARLKGKVSAFCGNTGVGKSSLLNAVDERLSVPTAEISQKLGRGRHTTRHVELFLLPEGGYVADTPGFSSMDLDRYEALLKDDLPACFREFTPYENKCRYTGCSHTKERDCAILQALEHGEIEPTRHQSYVSMWNEVKNVKGWELR